MWIRKNGVMGWRQGGVPTVGLAAGKRVGHAFLTVALVLIVAAGSGCKKSAPAPLVLAPAPVETVARVLWLGKQRLATDTNAASVMGIWNLPESQKLEDQTLDKLALGLVGGSQVPAMSNLSSVISNRGSMISNQLAVATNRMSVAGGQSPVTNPPSPIILQPSQFTGPAALLRPLLDDLIQQESFVNVRQATNLPGELAFAIKLNEERARLWQTNLAALLESLTGSRAVAVVGRSNGWQLQFSDAARQTAEHRSPIIRTFDLARAGDWTVLGLGPRRNELFGEVLGLIHDDATALTQLPKDLWLFADVDLRRVASALSLSWDLPADLPKMSLGITGDGQTVRTRCQLNFAKPLPFEREPWNIPTNLIHEPLVSFTALQGMRPWLASSKFWQGLGVGAPPNQLYLWAQRGPEFLSYFAAPMANASNWVEQATDRLLQKPNAYLASDGMGQFQRSTNGPGAIWADVLLTVPFLQPVTLSGSDFIFGGLVPSPLTNRPPAAELLNTVLGDTNLVAYDWELTGSRIDQWLHFGQLVRFALHLAQVPPKSASFAWLTALEPKLGGCVTAVSRTGPAQLSFVRRSGLGFTAAELDWLADWLESPKFPRGLNTFLGEPVPLPRARTPRVGIGASTNAAPTIRH